MAASTESPRTVQATSSRTVEDETITIEGDHWGLSRVHEKGEARPLLDAARRILRRVGALLDDDGRRRAGAFGLLDQLEDVGLRLARDPASRSRLELSAQLQNVTRALHRQLLVPMLPSDEPEYFARELERRHRHVTEVTETRLLSVQVQLTDLRETLQHLGRKMGPGSDGGQDGSSRQAKTAEGIGEELVYFALFNRPDAVKTHVLKIGKTSRGQTPARRITEHRQARSHVFHHQDRCVVELLGWTSGVERAWHDRFKAHRDRGEEFKIEGPVQEFVNRLLRQDPTLAIQGVQFPPRSERA